MRISTAFQYETAMRDVATAQERYIETQRQVSTGKKLNVPSDDPVGAATVLIIGSLQSAIGQYKKNIGTAKGYLGFTDGALEGSSTVMKRAYELAVRGATGTVDQTGREGMVREIDELQKRLVALGNTRGPSGQYIFAGQSTDVQPFTVSISGVSFNGDANDVLIEAGPGQTVTANVSAGQTLTDAYNALESLKNNLIGGNTGAISGVDITALQNSDATLNRLRGTVGARLQTVDALQSDHDRRTEELTSRASDIQDIDFSEAVMKFRLAETAYQAALGAASQGFRLSLMDFIRG